LYGCALHESEIVNIYGEYLTYISNNWLDKNVFVDYLRHLYSLTNESQTPEQTLKNTMAAMALLKGGK
jgi:hypothetical protein